MDALAVAAALWLTGGLSGPVERAHHQLGLAYEKPTKRVRRRDSIGIVLWGGAAYAAVEEAD